MRMFNVQYNTNNNTVAYFNKPNTSEWFTTYYVTNGKTLDDKNLYGGSMYSLQKIFNQILDLRYIFWRSQHSWNPHFTKI